MARGTWLVARGSWLLARNSWLVARGSWFDPTYARPEYLQTSVRSSD